MIGKKAGERCNRLGMDVVDKPCCGDLWYPVQEDGTDSVLLVCDVCGWVEGDD